MAFRMRRLAALVAASVSFSAMWPAIGAKPLAASAALSDPATFIKGVDVSTLQAIEDHGGKFYDGGVERDLFDILRDRGVNYVRVRVWNDPVEAGGYNDAAHLVALARRVKAKGLKLLVDFHYSDFWADPGRQTKPAAWASLTFEQLKQAVYDYTAAVLTDLRDVGAYPDMVQIGNEINNGILHPDGAASNFDNLAQLLAEGIRAVRDTTPPGQSAKIVLHLANGGNNAQFRWFFDNAVGRGLDFDVIGLSYYPYWHGSFQDLKNNLNDLAVRYGKEVVVVETAYPYTLADCDGWENAVRQQETDLVGFSASIESQRLMLLTVMNTVAHVAGGKGLGVFYWEPAWIPVPSRSWDGVGWKRGEGNAWENQAMFDCDGNALPSLDAFRFLPGDLDGQRPIGALPAPGVTTVAHEAPTLPATVDVLYDDGGVAALPVAWDAVDPDLLSRVGSFVHEGTVEGTGLRAKIRVTVVPSANRAVNSGFEDGWTPSGWDVSGDTAAVKIDGNPGNPHTGGKALNYWFGSPFSFTLSQTVTGLKNGQKYVLRGWVMGPWPGDTSQPQPTVYRMFAHGYGGPPVSVDLANAGWPNWRPFEIRGIVPTDGRVTIGFEVQAPAGAWGFIDDVELREDVTVPSWPQDARLSVAELSPESVRLVWTPATDEAGVAGYKLYMDGRRVVTVSGDTYGHTVTGLAPGTTHTFKVEAGNASDLWTSTGPSATVTLPPPPSSPPTSPPSGTPPTAVDGGAGVLTITPDRLQPAERPAGPLSVVLPGSVREARLTPAALAAAARNGLSVRTDGVTLIVAAEPLRRMGAEAASLSVRIEPVAIGAGYRLNDLGAAGTVAVYDGGAYAVGLAKVSADGRVEPVETFAEPVEFRLKPRQTASRLAGIYRIEGGRAVEYVGGRRTSDGEIAAFLRGSGTYALLEVRPAFADVADGHWAFEAVRETVAKGFAGPAAVDGFMPERPVTRAEFVEWLVKALRIETGGASAEPFADVPRDAPYASAVAAARAAGIVEGKGNRTFGPDQPLTREETAVLLARAMRLANVGPAAGENAGPFSDMADVAPWAADAVRAAADAGLFQGRKTGRFEPKSGMTRAEAAQVLWRLYRLAEW